MINRPTVLVLWGAGALIVGTAGPFGTFGTSTLPVRIGFWALVLAIAIPLALVLRKLVDDILDEIDPLLREMAYVAAYSFVLTAPLWVLVSAFFPDGGATQISFAAMLGFVALVISAVCVLRSLMTPPVAGPGDAQDKTPPILARVDEDLRGDILALSARDHYVDLVTDKGRGAILMRFADAMNELGDLDGIRVHRSHWVAREAVVGTARRNGRLFVTLVSGEEVPVSRTYRPRAEQAGLLGAKSRNGV